MFSIVTSLNGYATPLLNSGDRENQEAKRVLHGTHGIDRQDFYGMLFTIGNNMKGVI